MKNFILVLSLVLVTTNLFSFTPNENLPTPAKQEIIIEYLEKEYGNVQEIQHTSELLILNFENHLIYLKEDQISGIYNYKTKCWEDIQTNKKNIDNALKEFSFWELLSDESGPYISIKKYDDSFEYRLYFEEYYLDGEFIVYYNNSEKLKIASKKAYLDDIEFTFLN